jgi:hypothetical protein
MIYVNGRPILSTDKAGYIVMQVQGRRIKGHRLAWESVYGAIPDGMLLDHINGVKRDNRICNLRLATASENSRNIKKESNTTSKYKGVYWIKSVGRWMARGSVHGVRTYLGHFDCEDDAARAYNKYISEHHGQFARFNEVPEDNSEVRGLRPKGG